MKRVPWQAWAILVLLAIVASTVIGNRRLAATGTAVPGRDLYGMTAQEVSATCEQAARLRQIVPSSLRVVLPRSDPVRGPDNTWSYDFEADSLNGLGMVTRSAWHCEAKPRSVWVEQVRGP